MDKRVILVTLLGLLLLVGQVGAESECITCHKEVTPNIVKDFLSGAMGKEGVQNPLVSEAAGGLDAIDCKNCHGSKHTTMTDFENAKIPTPDTCDSCHPEKVEQFNAGKHSLAWVAHLAMPTTEQQPAEIMRGQRGCGGCHKMGTKEETGLAEYRYGTASCDNCHTRHSFSAAEARRPEACLPCHMGFDHPQWEMYITSKHGVIYATEGDNWDWSKRLSEADYTAPTCQVCHMPDGDHNVMTAWGFLGLRVEEPDSNWAADRAIILKAIGVLDADGNPTPRLDIVKQAKVARLTMAEWQAERDKTLDICSKCHSRTFAKKVLEEGDAILRESDALFAEGIELVADLYRDGILPKPSYYQELPSYPYPDLLRFYEQATPIEEDLYLIWMEYRMRAFQGAYHINFDYMHWYGWAPLKETLVRMKAEAAELRENAEIKSKLEKTGTTSPATAVSEKGICGPIVVVLIAISVVALFAVAYTKKRR
jgi:hypothetical protein